MKYIPLFILIQLVNFPLMLIGIPVTVFDLVFNEPVPWIWYNTDDKPQPGWSKLYTFYWLALRNPVANLRHVPGVSKAGRPIFYRTFTIFGRLFYEKAGWMSNGYPAFSAGSGRGY